MSDIVEMLEALAALSSGDQERAQHDLVVYGRCFIRMVNGRPMLLDPGHTYLMPDHAALKEPT